MKFKVQIKFLVRMTFLVRILASNNVFNLKCFGSKNVLIRTMFFLLELCFNLYNVFKFE